MDAECTAGAGPVMPSPRGAGRRYGHVTWHAVTVTPGPTAMASPCAPASGGARGDCCAAVGDPRHFPRADPGVPGLRQVLHPLVFAPRLAGHQDGKRADGPDGILR